MLQFVVSLETSGILGVTHIGDSLLAEVVMLAFMCRNFSINVSSLWEVVTLQTVLVSLETSGALGVTHIEGDSLWEVLMLGVVRRNLSIKEELLQEVVTLLVVVLFRHFSRKVLVP